VRPGCCVGDVIWAAMIAVAGSSITGTIAYLGARLQAKTTAVDVAAQTTVELAKLRAENDRLWAQHREDERRNRQGTHHRLLAVLDRFETLDGLRPPARGGHRSGVL
jgi:hypothetical protein